MNDNLELLKICDVYPARAVVSMYYGFNDEYGDKISIEKSASRELYAVRVVVIAGYIMIAADSPTGPVLIFSQTTDPSKIKFRPGKNDESFVITHNGRLIVFKRDDSCGCGSKLRAWNPLKTVKTLIAEDEARNAAVAEEIEQRDGE